MYSRVLLALGVVAILLLLMWNMFGNLNVIPGYLFIGSAVAPVAVLVFFFEINAPRNISLVRVLAILFVGGVLSLLLTLVLFETNLTDTSLTSYIGAFGVGLTEELGKALIVAYFISKMKGRTYILNGLLMGAAVGAGFAMFESAGYAFRYVLSTGTVEAATNVIIVRGVLAPGGHVAWAAIEGAAMMIVKGSSQFAWDMLLDKRFLAIFAIAVVLHGLWDSMGLFPWVTTYISKYGTLAVLIILVWIVVGVMIARGIKQINDIDSKTAMDTN